MMRLHDLYNKGLCPVCGYEMFKREGIYPWGEDGDLQSDEICPCCGTQFGYTDACPTLEGVQEKWKLIRQEWIKNGMKYKHFDDEFPIPSDYNPMQQLKNIGIEIDGSEKN